MSIAINIKFSGLDISYLICSLLQRVKSEVLRIVPTTTSVTRTIKSNKSTTFRWHDAW